MKYLLIITMLALSGCNKDDKEREDLITCGCYSGVLKILHMKVIPLHPFDFNEIVKYCDVDVIKQIKARAK